MKKLATSALVLAAVFVSATFLTGCAGLGQVPVPGFLYSEYKAPAYDVTTETTATGVSKVGKATCESILGLIALGDCSIEAGKKAGGITKVAAIDYEYKNILGVYATYMIKVSGQ